MKLSSETKELATLASVMVLVILTFLSALFGIIGLKVGLGIIFVSLPFYFILNSLNLAEGERFVFSLLLGLTIFPSIAFLIGFAVSFKIAIIINFIIFIFIAIMMHIYKNRKIKR